MDGKTIEKLELNKILLSVSEYASSAGGKAFLCALEPSNDYREVKYRLDLTEECHKLLFDYGIGKVEEFFDVDDELKRSGKGSALSCAELLKVSALLRSARIAYTSVTKIQDETIIHLKNIVKNIYFDEGLENDITEKIISDDALSDFASARLYEIRLKIKNLNERIRARLAEYSSGRDGEFLQSGTVTIRNDRYVIPVKAEYKSKVKGFVHDRSQTGATFFIEPEYILELNNELIALQIDEREEIEAILKALSKRVGAMCNELIEDGRLLSMLDALFAIAEYGYKIKAVRPAINNRGYIYISKGRHPLIAADKVVAVSLELGKNYNYLLLSGANTGGKTVTLKMTGLFCLMAACGLYIPAADGSEVAVFNDIFADIGDSQSIEESLSTFSSHLTNVIKILEKADGNSLVLIDELGGGTNPDEGQALAKAIVKYFIDIGSKGIVTTHFTPLKEFAYAVGGIENASMEFDTQTLKPLYKVKIGMPGASNAFAISRRLGMSAHILSEAESYLSEGVRNFENVLKRAEESRLEAENKLSEANKMRLEWEEKLNTVNKKIDELNREKEKINRSARIESRRIISERTEKAEEILDEMEAIFKKEEQSLSDLIKARTLKHKLSDIAYDEEEEKKKISAFTEATPQNLKAGMLVYVKPMDTQGTVLQYTQGKSEAEIQCGSLKMHVKIRDLQIIGKAEQKPQQKTRVVKSLPKDTPMLEINVLGLTVPEAIYELDNFIDRALTDNLEQIKIIHGVGTGKLRAAISEHLKKHRSVESFRAGKYGEGETGVTIIKLR